MMGQEIFVDKVTGGTQDETKGWDTTAKGGGGGMQQVLPETLALPCETWAAS